MEKAWYEQGIFGHNRVVLITLFGGGVEKQNQAPFFI